MYYKIKIYYIVFRILKNYWLVKFIEMHHNNILKYSNLHYNN